MTGSGRSLVTAVALAAAAGAVLPAARAGGLARLDPAGGLARFTRAGGRAHLGGLAVVVATSAATVPVVGVLPVLLTLAVAGLGRRELRRVRALRAADRRRAALGELLSALVGELRSGAEPRPAVVAAGTGLAGLEPLVAAATHSGGDVPAALVALARGPGGSSAGELAAVWRVGEVTGCGLAAPVARVLRGHRARDRLRREVAAQLAGPTATAYLLSALPLVGIALGTALGADPLRFLLGTPPGRATLVVGLALVGAGVAWTRRITTTATRGRLAEDVL